MKKKLSLLLLICILNALSINATVYSGSCGTNVSYSLDTGTGVLSITGSGAMYNYRSTYKAPWDSNRSYIKSIEIADGVTSIGDYAFYNCYVLTSVTIGNSVSSIGDLAFYYCNNLTSVTIPNSVTSIGSDAFYSCGYLESVTIGNSVTSIGDHAFYQCPDLTSVVVENGNTKYDSRNSCNAIIETASNTLLVGCKNTIIPNSVTSIGDYAFAGCYTLTSVTIPNSVTSIGVRAFANCYDITSIVVENGNTKYDSRNSCNAIIETASNTLLVGCKSTMIPNSVTSIGDDAFRDCIKLTSVTIPNSVTSIGDDAFFYCSGLTAVIIGNSVTSIGSCAFYNCSKLEFVTIPNSVTSIGSCAFQSCSKLESVTIGNSVTSIGTQAFYGCSALTSVTIPNSVISIGTNAFQDCSKLESVTIGNSVTSIGTNAFYPCSSLTSVHITDLKAWCEIDFNNGANPLISAHHLYLNGEEIIDLIIPDNVTSIGSYAFTDCSGLTSVEIPSSVTSIGVSAFYNCSSLTSVTIPNSVTSIGGEAFEGCTGLTSVTIGNSVTSIGSYAFTDCSGLTSITIPNSVTSIEYAAFRGCSGLTSVTSEIQEPFAFGSSAFSLISSSCILTVPYGTRDAYIAAGWTTGVFKGGIIEQSSVNIEMSSNEISTYCCPYDLDFSDVSGLKAYIMSGFSPSTSTLVLTPVTMVPAGTGLLLKGAEGSYEVPYTTTDMYYTNLLKGVTTATAIDPTDGEYTNFILSNGAHGIGFYTLSESGELAANKAYLQLPTTSVASLSRAMRLVFADDITGIDEKKAETKKEDNIFYDLQGRRVDNPTQGLYIVNGKKVFINK